MKVPARRMSRVGTPSITNAGIHCDLIRFLALFLLSAFFAELVPAQRAVPDPEFAKVPFEQWLSEPDQLHFHWTVKVPHAELSFHQRLLSSVDVELDGRDLDNHRHDGKIILLIQITDAFGTHYQEHGDVELDKLDPNVKDANLNYSQRAFLLPGDYQIAVAILDVATGKHDTSQLKARVSDPLHGSLSDAWHALPSVEFIGNDVSPESWYLPYIHGHVPWAAAVQSPIQLNVILNVTPSRRASGGLAAMIPSLKVIAASGTTSVSERVALVDLSRHKTVFEQSDSRDLDWERLRSSLGQASTASIDVHSLSDSLNDAQYFVSEVRRLIRASGDKPCALVVLTKSVSFESGEDLDPVSLEALPPCRIIYIRYHAQPNVNPMSAQMAGVGRRGRLGGGPPGIGSPLMQPAGFDQLASTLKPLSPKIIDVATPAEVTKALFEIQKTMLKLVDTSH